MIMTKQTTPDLPPLRIGFVGGHGHHYLSHALRDQALTIDAAGYAPGFDDADATRGRVGGLPGITAYDSLDQMLDELQPNVISVGTVYAHQSPMIVQAIERGIPVVSDKPIAASWDALRAIEQAVAKHQAQVITEFDFRCRATFRAARAAVSDGRIGAPVLATAQKSYRFGTRADFYKRRADYGSTMLWIASHAIDAIAFTTGLDFASVTATHSNVSKPDYGDEFEDHCAAVYDLSPAGTAIVHADFLRPAKAPTHGDDRLRIAGSQGVLEIVGNQCLLMTHDQPQRDIAPDHPGEPSYLPMLRAALLGETEWYSTAESLAIAGVLLASRDAADTKTRVEVSR